MAKLTFNEGARDYYPCSKSRVRDYISLLKPRVMSLVVFSGIAGLYLAPGHIHPIIALVAILCIALGSGAAGAINMWYDRDIDAIMKRTSKRPIPMGLVEPEDALQFGVFLAAASVFIMAVTINFVAAFLLASAILFYVFIYTFWLKRSTAQNIVIGGAAGAFPPMIGWASVNGQVTIESIILFALIFMWTPPHFWALALYRSDDYARAGVPMLPVVSGHRETKKQIMIYTILLVITSFLPLYFKIGGYSYFFIALTGGFTFLAYAISLIGDEQSKKAPAMFGFSIIYLFIIFSALMLDKYLGWYW